MTDTLLIPVPLEPLKILQDYKIYRPARGLGELAAHILNPSIIWP